MILVTRLNGTEFYVNPELVTTIEENPDTVITLTNGEKLVVKESAEEMVQRFITFRARIQSFEVVKTPAS